jgi:hypothetical protein
MQNGRISGKHEDVSAGDLTPRGKPLVVFLGEEANSGD